MRADKGAGLWAITWLLVSSSACGSAPSAPVESQPSTAEKPTSVPRSEPELEQDDRSGAAPSEPGASSEAAPTPEAPTGPAFDEGSTVLVVGDSFSQSLGVGLKPILKERGVRVVIKGQKATFIPEWAGTKMGMELAVMQYKPELVLIVLGGNELGIEDPTIRASRIRRVVGNAKGRPCVWVAPALWEFGDPHGLLEVIRKNSQPCRYYDSNALAGELPRGGDKIHPDIHGQRMWAEALLEWLAKERNHSADGYALKPRPDDE